MRKVEALISGVKMGSCSPRITDPAPVRKNPKTRLSVDQRKTRPDTDKGLHRAGELKCASQLGNACTD